MAIFKPGDTEDQLKKEFEEVINTLRKDFIRIFQENIAKRNDKPTHVPPFMTLVEVSDDEEAVWQSTYSKGQIDHLGFLMCFQRGHSALAGDTTYTECWPKYRVHPDVNRHLWFFDHEGGECPVGDHQKVVCLLSNGDVVKDEAFHFNWFAKEQLPGLVLVKRYAYWHEEQEHD